MAFGRSVANNRAYILSSHFHFSKVRPLQQAFKNYLEHFLLVVLVTECFSLAIHFILAIEFDARKEFHLVSQPHTFMMN